MYRCLFIVFVVLISLIMVAPLAYAAPTDPIWIAGVYDLEDNDNAILAASLTEKALQYVPLDVNKILPVIIGTITLDEAPCLTSASPPVLQIRAPPVPPLYVAE